MKTKQKFDNLQVALDFMAKSSWDLIFERFKLPVDTEIDNTTVFINIKSFDNIGCEIELEIIAP